NLSLAPELLKLHGATIIRAQIGQTVAGEPGRAIPCRGRPIPCPPGAQCLALRAPTSHARHPACRGPPTQLCHRHTAIFSGLDVMNLQQSAKERADELTADRLSVEKFAVGQSVPRKEDPKLLRGQGHYTDDISLPGQAYAVMVRSQNAHGVIRSIDTEAAKKMPGVLGVYTAA